MLIDAFLVDEIAVEPFTGDVNVDGAPTYGARVVHPARVEEILREVRGASGKTVRLVTVVATRGTISSQDRVWIAPSAGPDLPRTFPVGFVFVDADARSPESITRARRKAGDGGHTEFFF